MLGDDVAIKMVELGFTRNEAKAYLALLKNSPATRYELSKESGIPRSAIYDVISRLENIGAVSAVSSEPERYAPLSPDDLFTLLDKRFHATAQDLKESLKYLEAPIEKSNLWNIVGYTNLMIKAREMIENAIECIYINSWNREIQHLKPELLAAEKRGVKVVIFSFTRLETPFNSAFSYNIPEEKLEKIWPHRLSLIADMEELLLGEAEDQTQKRVAWTKNKAIIATAMDSLILDLNLYSSRKGISLENEILGKESFLEISVEKLLQEYNEGVNLASFQVNGIEI